MTKDKGGPPIDRDGAPEPSQEDSDRDRTRMTGSAGVKGGKPAPAGDCEAIDLDSAHDRAS